MIGARNIRAVWALTLMGGAIAATSAAVAAEGARIEASATETAEGASIKLKNAGEAPLPSATAQVAGGVLVVRFSAPVEGDISGLTAQAPRTIAAARRDGDGRSLRISLRRSLQAELSQGESAATISLTPASAAASAEARPAIESAPTGAPTASVSVGVKDDLTRLSFRIDGGANLTTSRQGDRLELRFSRPADIDLSRLRANPPRLVRAVERVSQPGARLAIALTLAGPVKVRTFKEGSGVIVDLSPDEAASAAAAAPPPPPPPPVLKSDDPAPRNGVVPVAIEESESETKLTLNWAGPARAAAFKRGDSVWLLFDTRAQFDIRGARRTEISSVRGEGVAGVRIRARPGINISARAQGNSWIFTLGPREAQVTPASVRRDVDATGRGRIMVGFERDGVVRKIVDPSVGDTLQVGLTAAPLRGVVGRRATPDATVLESFHGAAVELRNDSMGAAWDQGSLVVSHRASLPAKPQTEDPFAENTASYVAGQLDVTQDSRVPREKVLDRKDELQRKAAAEGTAEGARVEARLALARFLIAHELSAEALGALKVATVNQPQIDVDPRFRLMRAAAGIMMGRLKAAKSDLDVGSLADDPAAALWRGYLAYQERDWATARTELERGMAVLGTQPRGWQSRFTLALSAALLEGGAVDAAAEAVKKTLALNPDPAVGGQAKIIQARVAESRGDGRAALAAVEALMKSPQESVAIRAAFEVARIKRELGAADTESVALLDALRWRWRGDDIELQVVQQLAALYAQQGRYREALTALRSASSRRATSPLGRTLRMDMSDLFERLYLDGEADKLEPIQALGLFYDFKELTPVGPNGDRMVRSLSGRLVALDLLEQAATLLQHQVEERLEGVGRAQIAADLAVIYLRDRKPEKALTAIEMSRQPNMPSELLSERRILEAKAYLDLGRTEQAVEILERDRSPAAQRVRAEAAWKDRDWPRAAAELKQVLAMRTRGAPLSDEERNIVMRAAIALTFADNATALAALRKEWGPAMATTPDANAFEIVSAGIDKGGATFLEAARSVARTDLLDRFLRDLKARMSAPKVSADAAKPQPRA